MYKHRYEKKTLNNEWVEVRIVLQREKSPDYTMEGEEAKTAIAQFVLSLANGIADAMHAHKLAATIHALWKAVAHVKGVCDESCEHDHGTGN